MGGFASKAFSKVLGLGFGGFGVERLRRAAGFLQGFTFGILVDCCILWDIRVYCSIIWYIRVYYEPFEGFRMVGDTDLGILKGFGASV